MPKNVLILFGGKSSEYEISLKSAAFVLRETPSELYQIYSVGITKSGEWFLFSGDSDSVENGEWIAQPQNLKRAVLSPDSKTHGLVVLNDDHTFETIHIDIAFGVLHGKFGEDGTLQGLFEIAGIPYVGPNVVSSANCMDKVFSRIIFDSAGLPQTKWMFFTKNEFEFSSFSDIINRVNASLSYPVFVKPANAGSSVGISKVKNEHELKAAFEFAFIHDHKILVEEGVDAREIEVAVLGNHDPIVSPCGEIVSCNEFYDYDAKYVIDSELQIPALLPSDICREVERIAKQSYRALNCEGLSRVDFLVRKTDNKVFLNEINTIPGFTKISMYPKLFAQKGIPAGKLLQTLFELAVLRFEEV